MMRDLIQIVENHLGINESYVEHGRLRIPFWKNPSSGSLITQLYKTEDMELRGLICGRDVYWWEARLGTHHGMARLIGIPYDNDWRLHLRVFSHPQDDDELRLDFSDNMMNNPQIERILQSGEILLDGGSQGWITLEEYRSL